MVQLEVLFGGCLGSTGWLRCGEMGLQDRRWWLVELRCSLLGPRHRWLAREGHEWMIHAHASFECPDSAMQQQPEWGREIQEHYSRTTLVQSIEAVIVCHWYDRDQSHQLSHAAHRTQRL